MGVHQYLSACKTRHLLSRTKTRIKSLRFRIFYVFFSFLISALFTVIGNLTTLKTDEWCNQKYKHGQVNGANTYCSQQRTIQSGPEKNAQSLMRHHFWCILNSKSNSGPNFCQCHPATNSCIWRLWSEMGPRQQSQAKTFTTVAISVINCHPVE